MKTRWLLPARPFAAGCSSTAPIGIGDMLAASGGAGNFAGTYAATLNETVTVTGFLPGPFTGSATISFAAGAATDMVETLSYNGQSCMFTYNRSGDSASASPADQSCSYTLPNGNHQTNTDSTHMATINGNQLTINIAGAFVGTTPSGATTAARSPAPGPAPGNSESVLRQIAARPRRLSRRSRKLGRIVQC